MIKDMIKTFEQFTEDEINKMLNDIESKKNLPKLKVGDILDLDQGHVAPGARLFAKVTNTLEPANVAEVESIICHRRPYLCDHVFETLVALTDTHLLADMDLFNKMLKDKEIIISEKDPYGEEIWDDDWVEDEFNIPNFDIGDEVDVPEPNPDDIHLYPFRGTIIGFRNGLAQVRDMDDDVFEIEPERLLEPID